MPLGGGTGPQLRRQTLTLRGANSRAQRTACGCLVSPCGRLVGRERIACTFREVLKAEFRWVWKTEWGQVESKVLCVTYLIDSLPDTVGSVLLHRIGGGGTPSHSPPAHTRFRCAFQFPFHILRHQLSQSIATISAGYFPSHGIQNKQHKTTES